MNLLFVLLLLPSCSKLPIAAKCATADQCETGVCVLSPDPANGGICAASCVSSSTCPIGFACMNVKRCASDTSASVYACLQNCQNSSDCYEGTVCTTVSGSLACFMNPPSTPCP